MSPSERLVRSADFEDTEPDPVGGAGASGHGENGVQPNEPGGSGAKADGSAEIVERGIDNLAPPPLACFCTATLAWNQTAVDTAQEYKITDKIYFGTDFPFARVGESVDGLLNINDMLEGTRLPRVSSEFMQQILWSDPFADWWHGDNPLA